GLPGTGGGHGRRQTVMYARWLLALSAVATILLVVDPGFAYAQQQPAGPATQLRAALNASDVDSALHLFASDAVVIQPRIGGFPQIYVGQEQIRWWLRNLVTQHVV